MVIAEWSKRCEGLFGIGSWTAVMLINLDYEVAMEYK